MTQHHHHGDVECDVCSGASSIGDLLASLDRMVDDIGWACTGVLDDPPWTYTIGLVETYQHPELVITGLPPEVAQGVFAAAVEQIKTGIRFEPGQDYEGIAVGFYVRFLPLAETATPQLRAARRRNGDDFEALQLIWPDRDGRFEVAEALQPLMGMAQ